MIKYMVKDTNTYGRVKRGALGKEWREVNCDEMLKFLGIMLFTGLKKAHGSMKEMWSNGLGRNEDIARTMPRDSFLEIFATIYTVKANLSQYCPCPLVDHEPLLSGGLVFSGESNLINDVS
eukprot:TRINITY_DN18419_c0_g1_i1.p2 TRINITY_DN18419_c0_g1~~TRINITY_DN18419_c0_g1_i1.p2  ORF type:complete len:121 (-),score=17.68 TRINITY_DN18419_c0_g1_i1:38-400(-)